MWFGSENQARPLISAYYAAFNYLKLNRGCFEAEEQYTTCTSRLSIIKTRARW